MVLELTLDASPFRLASVTQGMRSPHPKRHTLRRGPCSSCRGSRSPRFGARSRALDFFFSQNKLSASHRGSAIPALPRALPSIRNAIPAPRIAHFEIAHSILEPRNPRDAHPPRSPRHGPHALRRRTRSMRLRAPSSRLGTRSLSGGPRSVRHSRGHVRQKRARQIQVVPVLRYALADFPLPDKSGIATPIIIRASQMKLRGPVRVAKDCSVDPFRSGPRQPRRTSARSP
jgi:hypothetical protein